MGINGLWDVLGEGDVWHIADYAAKHFNDTGRPLRIAVDEATWRFTNLTPEQVEKIRQGEPAANPVEKTILWRILRLWRLNIQLLFVYDGLRKPGKSRNSGRGGGKVDQECTRLLHQMFRLLKVPFHQAPGEAEAECALLQRLGVVDAVWSDDGDSFMFGCNTLIKAQKVGGKRVNDHIRVYKADSIAQKLDFDANSLILFALLAGGDYDTTGLRGCGPVNAARVCKRTLGLAKRIVTINPYELPAWRHDLGEALRNPIPSDFPKMKVLDGYRKPAISTEDQGRNLSQLRDGWVKEINEDRLRVELRQRYNFTTREYLKHLGPVFLARALARGATPFSRNENLRYGVQLKSNRRTKDKDGNPTKSEVKIKYSAHELVKIDIGEWPPRDEDWSKFAAKDGTPYDPRNKIEGEMLECLLEYGLPQGSWDPPATTKKGKWKAEQDEVTEDEDSEDDIVGIESSARHAARAFRSPAKNVGEMGEPTPKKRGRPPKDPSERAEPARKKRNSKKWEAEPGAEKNVPPAFRHLDITDPRPSSNVIDVHDEGEEEASNRTLIPQTSQTSTANKPTPTKGLPVFRPLTSRKKDDDESSEPIERSKHPPKAKTKPPAAKSKTSPHRPPPGRSSQGDKANKPNLPRPPLQMSTTAPTAYPVPTPPTSAPAESIPSTALPRVAVVSQSPSEELVPGQNIDRARLRELRLAALQNAIGIAAKPVEPPHKTASASLVIDLT